MKKFIWVATACLLAGPASAQPGHSGSSQVARGGVANSATVVQTAGAFAFSQVAQGDQATIEAPKKSPLVQVDSGAFILPYVSASDHSHISVHDPIGNVDLSGPN